MTRVGVAILSVVAFVVLFIGVYLLHWWLAVDTTDRRYHADTHNEQYQSGLISQARDDARGWGASMDPDQKQLLANEFCGAFSNITDVPKDVAMYATQIGC